MAEFKNQRKAMGRKANQLMCISHYIKKIFGLFQISNGNQQMNVLYYFACVL